MNDHSTTEEVSAKLTLLDESWIASNWELVQESAHRYHSASVSRTKKSRSRTALEAELNQREVARRMKCYTHEEEEEERKMGISTELKLYEDPFKIKKRLTKSDLGNMCRLLLGSNLINAHVLPYLNTDLINQIESNKGAPMTVWDQDTNSEHKLVMKRWAKWKSYVLIEKWKADFVQRRNLQQGDEIGLLWDPYNSRFNFRVLKQALEE